MGKGHTTGKSGKKHSGAQNREKGAQRRGPSRRSAPFSGPASGRRNPPAYESEGRGRDSGQDAELSALLSDTLHKANRPLGMDELLRITRLPRRTKKHLEYLLTAMQERGLVVKGATGWSNAARLRYVEGTLALQRGGMGFVTPLGGGQDVFISPSALNGAWHGDKVKTLLLPGRRGPSPEGRIVAVLERTQREIAATALKEQDDGTWMCAPADRRIQALFVTDVASLSDALHHAKPVREKDLLLLTPGEQLGPNLWRASATVNLETEENPAAQERLVKSSHDIPTEFPAAVLAEAAAFPPDPEESEFSHRERLEDRDFVTIDGSHAKDFDDAVLVERENGEFRLRVAIADVAHYVSRESALDREARLRGNSYYFPLSVEPMLPVALSNGLCSLRPSVPRLVMVADMLFTGDGERTGARFYPAVIISKARLTYEQVERHLTGEAREPELISEAVLRMLRQAGALANLLLERRRAKGGLDFDLPEPEEVFDQEGRIIALKPRTRLFSHRLIEVFMVAANEAVAEFLEKQGEGTLYRDHQPPDPEKLASLVAYLDQTGLAPGFAARFGSQRRKARVPSARDLASLLDEVQGSASAYTVNRLLLRSMMQARYAPDNEGHFGLASSCYCHFTSPIRRYADLVTHRALKHALGQHPTGHTRQPHPDTGKPYTRSRLTGIADHINACERTASEAEREIHKRIAILLLKDRCGETFDGVIAGLADFGIFVELPAVMTEGMIPLGSLNDDFYQHIPEKQELRGTGTGRVFRLGQPLSVRLVDVNLNRLEVTLEPVDTDHGRRKRRR